jgi:hypothetical protein
LLLILDSCMWTAGNKDNPEHDFNVSVYTSLRAMIGEEEDLWKKWYYNASVVSPSPLEVRLEHIP